MIDVDAFQAGQYVQNGEFRCFVPSLVNDQWEWRHPEINVLLAKASHSLGELNAFSRQAPNTDLFVYFSARAEAAASSRIEGTRTVLDEVVGPENEVLPERRGDLHEVQNYVAALREVRESPALPMSSRLIKRAHRTLMQGARGQNKSPGAFRRMQNWLGEAPSSAAFVPPPASEVDALMSDLERFLHNDRIQVSPLIRIAVAHYQFETIHPFMDGNGRIGRLIIPLYLVEKGITDKPFLYMSRYLEKNKARYYENLMRARAGAMSDWLKFFLVGADNAAAESARALKDMMALRETAAETIRLAFVRGESAAALLDFLFEQPVVGGADVAKRCGITPAAARTLIDKMRGIGILQELTKRRRNRLFVFREYLDIFKR